MKTKKIPMRSCIITKEKLEKKNLIRIVRTPEGKVILDSTGKANGRGAYLKKNMEVIEKAQKTKILERVLNTTIDNNIYEEAKNIVLREENK